MNSKSATNREEGRESYCTWRLTQTLLVTISEHDGSEWGWALGAMAEWVIIMANCNQGMYILAKLYEVTPYSVNCCFQNAPQLTSLSTSGRYL